MLHPAGVLLGVALVVALTRGVLQKLVLLLGTGLAVGIVLRLVPGAYGTLAFPLGTLHVLQVDALSVVFALIFSLITCVSVLYALQSGTTSEHVATLVYASAALGVVCAGDWLTLFTCWEVMAVASGFVVWHGGTARSRAAGMRYLLVHMGGGACLLSGIMLHLAQQGSMTLHPLTAGTLPSSAAFWLILLGVGINAAIPPLHAWLPDAYPEASVTGSVFLSVFTTKTAVYVLMRLFPGAEVLVWAGSIMALYGVVYAILADDMRRLLSYHIVSQVGYMVTGVGLGTDLALNGAAAHAFCHILYKALLFMAVGAVIQATGRRTLHDGGGLGRQLPLVCGAYMVAACSISGVPLFNGFISKSMIVSAAVEAHRPFPELLLTLASVGTFLSVGLKLPTMLFGGSDRGGPAHPVPRTMELAMLVNAGLCIGLGLFPHWLYRYLPFQAPYQPYTPEHVISTLQLLLGTGLGFWWCHDRFRRAARVLLDTDWLYRQFAARLFPLLVGGARQVGVRLETWSGDVLHLLRPSLPNPWLVLRIVGWRLWSVGGSAAPASHQRPEVMYNDDRSRLPIGVTILWILVFFVVMALYGLTEEP
jgi:multicomponent Na+:H+ antiporter subunit D